MSMNTTIIRKSCIVLLAEVLKWGVLVDPAPTGCTILNALKNIARRDR